MSKNAGDFTCGELQEVQVKIDRIWADSAVNIDFIAEVTALEAIHSNQTANLTVLESKDKDQQLKIQWLAICQDMLKNNCDDICTPGGVELESDCKNYALNICNQAGFTIPEIEFRTNTWSKEEVLARAMLAADKQLAEWATAQAVIALDSFTGVNKFDTGLGTVCGHDTWISAPFWTPDILGYFIMAAIMNKQRNSYMLSGQNLFMTDWTAMMNAGNAGGSGQAKMMGAIKKYYDLFNLDGPLGVKKTFMINPAAMAVGSKNYYDSTPTEYFGAGLKKWSMQSKQLPWITGDVTYTTRCEGNEIYHDYSIEWHLGMYQNPNGCDTELTGIMSFVCGDAPC